MRRYSTARRTPAHMHAMRARNGIRVRHRERALIVNAASTARASPRRKTFGGLHHGFRERRMRGSSSPCPSRWRPSRSRARLLRSARLRPARRCRRRARARSDARSLRDAVGAAEGNARPDAPHGNFATATLRPCFSASVAVRPAHAISGSVKTTAGIAAGFRRRLRSPAIASTAARPSCDALCEHRLAGNVAYGIDALLRRLAAGVDLDEAALVDLTRLSRPGTSELGRRPIDTSTRSNVRRSFSAERYDQPPFVSP